jgi:hypothetical protein
VLFAILWPFFRRRGVDATLVALFYAMVAWLVMYAAIAIASSNHPDYFDPNVIIARGPDREAGSGAICTMTGAMYAVVFASDDH